METLKITAAEMIKEIIQAVNAQAERTKGTPFATRRADAHMLFSLAFCSEQELQQICIQSGIQLY